MSTAILEGYGDLIIHDGNTDFTIVKPTPFATNSTKVKRWWRQNYNVVTYEACAIVELLDFYIVVSCAQDVQLKMTFDGTSAVTFDVGYDKPGDGNIERILVVPKTEFHNPVNYDDYYYDYSTRELRKNSYGNGAVFDIFLSAALDLKFAESKSLVDSISGNDLVSFTRASSGTFVGADGLIKSTSVNFALNSNIVQGSPIGTSILNSTESVVSPRGITETVRRLGRDLQAGGAQVWRVGSTSGGTPNTTYTISFYAKTVSGGTTSINIDINDGAPSTGLSASITGEWTRIVKTGGSRPNNLRFFDMNMVTATEDFYVWGAQIEIGTTVTDYIPTTSTISGAPRFDHNPSTGESLGLLIEESSTNRNNKSKSFSTWAVSSGFSLVYDAATAPDGTTSATALDRNGSGLARFEKNFGVNPGGSTTFSVFAKSVNTTTGRYLRLAVNDAQSGERFADFDLVDGTIDVAAANGGNFTGAVSRIEEYPNDWYRCSITFRKTSTGSENSICFHKLYIRQSDNTTNTPSGVTDVGMYLWGGQVEEKTFPTSLIETDGSQVTRAADIAEITGTNFFSFYNTDSNQLGTMFVHAGTNNPNNFDIVEITSGSIFTRDTIRHNVNDGVTALTSVGGGQNSQQYVSSGTTAIKAAGNSVLGFAVNGTSTINAGNQINNNGNMTRLVFGRRSTSNNTEVLNGHIKRFAYFSTNLDVNTLKSITS